MYKLLIIITKVYLALFPKKVVLGFHSIGKKGMPTKKLYELCCFLENVGFDFSPSVNDIMRVTERKNIVHFTFDDGYFDNLSNAKPVLSEKGIKATIFLVTGFINGNVMPGSQGLSNIAPLSKKNLSELVNEGWQLGYHTSSHIDLFSSTHEEIVKDLYSGNEEFMKMTEGKFKDCFVFAYPFGHLPKDQVKFKQILESLDVSHAITTRWGEASSSPEDKYYVNRVMIGDHDTKIWIALKICGFLNIYNKLKWRGEKYARRA
ncbi:TPA: polysaccharide deacetylase family protein [Vibrio harveyi]|nr:polysaccharide deacetylase family protein [Vibrio harveyi]